MRYFAMRVCYRFLNKAISACLRQFIIMNSLPFDGIVVGSAGVSIAKVADGDAG
jgi:hypothetical protein